jgi:hypothetical protein
MGKISTYGNVNPVNLTDKVIGTNVTGTPNNVTKNFLISDLLALFQENITLQNVLDAGNTATEDINLTGNISLDGGNFTLDPTASLYVGGLLIDSTGAVGALGQTLTSDASGNPVWGSGGGGSQNLEQLLAVGNTATNDINLTGDLNLTGNIVETGNLELTGNITQVGDYDLTGNMTHLGDYELTGNITMIGDPDITGDVTHSGNYLFEVGQFSFEGTSTLLLEGAVKDSTGTLGSDGEVLVSDASGKFNWQSLSQSPTTTTVNAFDDPVANADIIFYSASGAGGTINLNAALVEAGKKVVLVRTSTTAAANISSNGGALINGAAAKALPTTLYSGVTCICDGTDWYCSAGQPL